MVGFAQEAQFRVGAYIKLNPCKTDTLTYFESMDLYSRTQMYDKSKYDTMTGDGLVEEFFKGSSIDAKRVPCVMGNRAYRIAALHEFDDKGKKQNVAICYDYYPNNILWINLDMAIELNEIDVRNLLAPEKKIVPIKPKPAKKSKTKPR